MRRPAECDRQRDEELPSQVPEVSQQQVQRDLVSIKRKRTEETGSEDSANFVVEVPEYMALKSGVEAVVETGARSKAALKIGARSKPVSTLLKSKAATTEVKPKSVTTWGTSLPVPKSWIVASAKVMVLGDLTAARSKTISLACLRQSISIHCPVYLLASTCQAFLAPCIHSILSSITNAPLSALL